MTSSVSTSYSAICAGKMLIVHYPKDIDGDVAEANADAPGSATSLHHYLVLRLGNY